MILSKSKLFLLVSSVFLCTTLAAQKSNQIRSNTGTPGFVGKKWNAGYTFGYSPQLAEQPRSADNEGGFALFGFINPMYSHGVFIERAWYQNISARIGFNQFTAFAQNRSTRNNYSFQGSPFPSYFPNTSEVVYTPTPEYHDHFAIQCQEIAFSLRAYNPFMPIGIYFELGANMLFYKSGSYEFMETVANLPNETVQSNGHIFTYNVGVGYNRVLFDKFTLGFGGAITMRTFQAMSGYDDVSFGSDKSGYAGSGFDNLHDSFDNYISFHAITARALTFNMSIGYLF
jgi:hypothetical protein